MLNHNLCIAIYVVISFLITGILTFTDENEGSHAFSVTEMRIRDCRGLQGEQHTNFLGIPVAVCIQRCNRPFAACHSRGTKPPCWDAKVVLGQDNKGNYNLKLCMPFVGLAPVLLLRPSMAVQ